MNITEKSNGTTSLPSRRRARGLRALCAILLLFLLPAPIRAFSPEETRAEALDSILPHYSDWGTAELTGRLRIDKLPVAPTVKIFMRKGTEIDISVRAPFVGEAGRIVIAGDSVMAVNRLKHVYCVESIAGIEYEYPGLIADIQSLLLGRVVVFRAGQLSARNADFLDFSVTAADSAAVSPSGTWDLVFPKGRTDEDEFGYTYRVDTSGRIAMLRAELLTHDIALQLDYEYTRKNTALSISFFRDYELKGEAAMEFGLPRWGAEPPAPVTLSDRYTQVGIRNFIKSFGK